MDKIKEREESHWSYNFQKRLSFNIKVVTAKIMLWSFIPLLLSIVGLFVVQFFFKSINIEHFIPLIILLASPLLLGSFIFEIFDYRTSGLWNEVEEIERALRTKESLKKGLKIKKKIFISYSKEDRPLATKLHNSLEAKGFDTFLDKEDLEIADKWEEKIPAVLSNSDIVIPLLSESFLSSQFANQEIGIAVTLEKKILPVVTKDNLNVSGFLRKLQWLKINEDSVDEVVEKITQKINSTTK